MEIDNVQVSTKCELLRDLVGEAISREVEDSEINEILEVGRDWASEEIGGEVEGL